MKTRPQFFTMAIIALVAVFALIGCKEDEPDPQPQPVAQSYTISEIPNMGSGTVDVVINYTALPGVMPSYISTLETVVRNIIGVTGKTGIRTINIISSGADGFVITDSGMASANESWIAKATEMEMGMSLQSLISLWLAMNKSNAKETLRIAAIQPNQTKEQSSPRCGAVRLKPAAYAT